MCEIECFKNDYSEKVKQNDPDMKVRPPPTPQPVAQQTVPIQGIPASQHQQHRQQLPTPNMATQIQPQLPNVTMANQRPQQFIRPPNQGIRQSQYEHALNQMRNRNS